MIETILTVSNYDLQRLNSGEAVAIFSELLWAEADAIGIQKSLIDVPSALTVADGGVDAEVSNARGQGGQGIIQKGLTRYQIKTGDFKLSDDSKIKEILFRKKGNQLKPRIQSCLDKNGTLVVVLFGWDNPEKADHKIIEKFRQQLSKVDNQYKTAKLRIFKQNNLISFFKPFPSLALKVNRRALYKFKTHSSLKMKQP